MGPAWGTQDPVGLGACIYLPNQTEPVMLKRPVTNRGSILLGELIAILMELEFVQIEYTGKDNLYGITIFSDSQSAVGILTLGWVATSHKKLFKMYSSNIRLGEVQVKCKY